MYICIYEKLKKREQFCSRNFPIISGRFGDFCRKYVLDSRYGGLKLKLILDLFSHKN